MGQSSIYVIHITRGAFLAFTEAEKLGERERTVMSYEQAFEQIKEATGITDIDKLVNKFIEGIIYIRDSL